MKPARTIQINAMDVSAVAPIEALPRPSRVPLSFPQLRLWLLPRLSGGREACHIQMWLRLRGELDESARQSALNGLVARHEVLRATFGMEDGEPYQRIGLADVGLPPKQDDLTVAADVEATLADLMCHEAQAAFDLEAGPLIRGWLVRLAVDYYELLITSHHMVSDAWSPKILTRAFSELYAAAREGRADRLAPLPVQYADYALWHRRWLTREMLERQSEYWLRILAGARTVLKRPTDWPRAAQQHYSGNFIEFVLHEPLTTQIKALSRRHRTTLFVTLLASWALVLARLSGQDDLVIGAPSGNRTRSEIAGLIGLFINTLGLRIDLSDDPMLATLLERVNAAALGAQANQDFPFEQPMELVNSRIAHTPTLQVTLAWQNNGVEPAELPGLKLEYIGVDPVAQHDLALELAEVGEAICGRLIYATSLFERSTVERLVGYLQQALSQMAADSGQRVWSAPLVLAEEHHRFRVESNPTEVVYPQDHCIQELLEAQEERDPEVIAVGYEDQCLSSLDPNVLATTTLARLDHRPPTRIRELELRP
ncbi:MULTISPECIES: condensation domain-containing protein [Mesorhizobium]|uniref:condensation domain-containing protein n=1 Tax=Mesorhizobium TaxID=68287 RepID=UPI0007EC85BE|nr:MULTISPECIES: condensation domain-containing protein [Mesorhizobium]PBB51821.1 hypothetical protein CK223_33090 [Mesorhizobium loti]QIA25324.1 hypothetical protein A9K68_028885 [Mesorhizobium sp. AA22]